MGTLLPATAPQTLYVTIRRDELRQLKEERDLLLKKVAHLSLVVQQPHLMSSVTALQA
jgi:hypothetical protein